MRTRTRRLATALTEATGISLRPLPASVLYVYMSACLPVPTCACQGRAEAHARDRSPIDHRPAPPCPPVTAGVHSSSRCVGAPRPSRARLRACPCGPRSDSVTTSRRFAARRRAVEARAHARAWPGSGRAAWDGLPALVCVCARGIVRLAGHRRGDDVATRHASSAACRRTPTGRRSGGGPAEVGGARPLLFGANQETMIRDRRLDLILGITKSPNLRIAEALILTESRIARRCAIRPCPPAPV